MNAPTDVIRHTVTDGIAQVTIDRPPLNILTREMLGALRDVLALLGDDPKARVILLAAEGKHFSAGADVAEHLPPTYRTLIPEFLDTVAALDGCPLPTVAAVQGRCLGGAFELILGADIVFATEDAVFGQPEILLGVIPPAAAALLPTRCPRGVAAEIVFTGDPFTADEAARWGLVRRVLPGAVLMQEARALAQRITRHSRAALIHAKRALRTRATEDRAALDAAGALYVDGLMNTADANEGLNAFLAKRPPVWSHR